MFYLFSHISFALLLGCPISSFISFLAIVCLNFRLWFSSHGFRWNKRMFPAIYAGKFVSRTGELSDSHPTCCFSLQFFQDFVIGPGISDLTGQTLLTLGQTCARAHTRIMTGGSSIWTVVFEDLDLQTTGDSFVLVQSVDKMECTRVNSMPDPNYDDRFPLFTAA